MELVREAYGYTNRPAVDVSGPDWLYVERFDVLIRPTVRTWAPQMLGLKLERGRVGADVIVAERIERPTENGRAPGSS